MAQNILAKMAVQISANTAEFNKALQKTSKDINKFTSDLKGVAGAVGVAFGVQQLLQFTYEASKLAGVFDGVKNSFDKLENSENLLKDLTSATAGAVSELNLMKRAVQFSNFGLELSKLPSLLEFATKRAQATGQSVDYLVDSIVTGLGRKSVLILDNLGISAVALKEEMAKVGDITVAVSNIIERDVANSGAVMQTAAIEAERFSVAIEDLKIAFGNLANSAGFSTSVKIATDFVNILSGKESGSNNAIYLPWGQVIKLSEEATSTLKPALGEIQKGFREAMKAGFNLVKPLETINALTAELKLLEEQKGELSGDALANTNREIAALKEKLKVLQELGLYESKSRGGVKESPDRINTSQIIPGVSIPGLKEMIPVLDEFNKKFQEGKISIEEWGASMRIILAQVEESTIDITANIAGGIASIADAFGRTVISGENFGKEILTAVASFAQQLGGLLIAAGLAKISFDKFNGPQMVAAGAALIAVAGAVKATISRRPNLSKVSSGGGSYSRNSLSSAFQDIRVTGTLVGEGSQLIAVLGNAQNSNSRRRA